jgi:hypothetical protein
VSGTVSIALVLLALFIMGTAETFADSATSTLLPGLVAREDLGIGNSRLQGAFLLMSQLLMPPVGAFCAACHDGRTMGATNVGRQASAGTLPSGDYSLTRDLTRV